MKSTKTHKHKVFTFITLSVSLTFSLCLTALSCALLVSHSLEGKLKDSPAGSSDSLLAGYPLSTSGTNNYSSYLTHYYDNLTNNFGMNYDSSCGYVATAMLLSYYDATFDANLVSANKDVKSIDSTPNLIVRRNSPGVLHDDFESTGFSGIYNDYPGANLYYTYCQQISSYSLHARLITIGGLLHYVNTGVFYNGFTTTLSQRIDILEYYLENIVGLTDSYYNILSGSYDYTYFIPTYISFTQNIVDLIDSGKPVLLSIRNSNGNYGHAVIAYDYYETTTVPYYGFYCHPGIAHQNYSTHMTLEDMGYSWVSNYMALELDYSATIGSNYVLTNNGTVNSYSYDSSILNWQNTN